MAGTAAGRHRVAAPSDRLAALIGAIGLTARQGRLEEGLRLADCALRLAPGELHVRMLHSRLLARAGRATEALQAIPPGEQTAAIELLRLELLLDAGALDAAQTLASTLLNRQAIDHFPGLRHQLDRCCIALNLPGWVGVHSSLQVVVRFRAGAEILVGAADGFRSLATVLEVDWQQTRLPATEATENDQSALEWQLSDGRPLPTRHDGTWQEAAMPLGMHRTSGSRPSATELHLQATDGRLLPGSPLAWPPHFGAEGWVLREEQQLTGSIGLRWAPRLPRVIEVYQDGALMAQTQLEPRGVEGDRVPFQLALPATTGALPLRVALRCPDGALHDLLGSPASASPAPLETQAATQQANSATGHLNNMVDILIPVFAGHQETLRCVHSVLESVSPAQAAVVVINDASPDTALVADLQALAANDRITLLNQPLNQGFPAAVNVGLAVHPDRDVVILNADACVHGDWLQRLRNAAHSAADIGSASPLGQAASILTYPLAEDEPPTPSGAELDRLAAQVHAGQRLEIPVGVGFCMYLRRDCLNAAGEFDAAAFRRGYGEENDLCLRATQLGWRHLAALDVYVEHLGGRSFGAERMLWMERNRRLLNLRHPGYDQRVEQFLARDPLHVARRGLDSARLRARAGHDNSHERVLLVSLALPGGVQKHVDSQVQILHAQASVALLLRPLADRPGAVRLKLASPATTATDLPDLYFDCPQEADALLALLRELGVDRIDLHHFLDLPAELIDALLALELPCQITLHDYSWLCPRLTLTGGDQRYCGEPVVSACEACIAQHGSELEPGLSVAQLRARSRRWLNLAKRIVVPCEDVRERYLRYFPELSLTVQPWESGQDAAQPIADWAASSPPAQVRPCLRVAMLGAISAQKGYHVLLACARAAAQHDLPIEFVLIGYSEDDAPLLATGRVFVTGPYKDEELPRLLGREACHLVWFPSVAPETWCYTLSHALRLDMPVAGFDLGAIGERLRGHARADLHPLDTPIDVLLERLLHFGAKMSGLPLRRAAKPAVNPLIPATGYRAASPEDTTMTEPAASVLPGQTPGPDALHTATVQPLTLPEGTYAIRVPGDTRRAHAPANGTNLILPAMGIGQAPMVQKGVIDLFTAPGTLDRWLTAPGDQITARISAAPATLLLTSVRPPHSAPLSIEVRRLDQPLPPVAQGRVLTKILLHVQWLGDVHFAQGQAGPLGEGLGVEALQVDCRDTEGVSLLEYRGRTADGFDTPWLSDELLCGSRGRGVPLLAFAVRPRASAANRYRLQYRGWFRSAGWVDAPPSGAWCQSPVPQDPLEGLELTIDAL